MWMLIFLTFSLISSFKASPVITRQPVTFKGILPGITSFINETPQEKLTSASEVDSSLTHATKQSIVTEDSVTKTKYSANTTASANQDIQSKTSSILKGASKQFGEKSFVKEKLVSTSKVDSGLTHSTKQSDEVSSTLISGLGKTKKFIPNANIDKGSNSNTPAEIHTTMVKETGKADCFSQDVLQGKTKLKSEINNVTDPSFKNKSTSTNINTDSAPKDGKHVRQQRDVLGLPRSTKGSNESSSTLTPGLIKTGKSVANTKSSTNGTSKEKKDIHKKKDYILKGAPKQTGMSPLSNTAQERQDSASKVDSSLKHATKQSIEVSSTLSPGLGKTEKSVTNANMTKKMETFTNADMGREVYRSNVNLKTTIKNPDKNSESNKQEVSQKYHVTESQNLIVSGLPVKSTTFEEKIRNAEFPLHNVFKKQHAMEPEKPSINEIKKKIATEDEKHFRQKKDSDGFQRSTKRSVEISSTLTPGLTKTDKSATNAKSSTNGMTKVSHNIHSKTDSISIGDSKQPTEMSSTMIPGLTKNMETPKNTEMGKKNDSSNINLKATIKNGKEELRKKEASQEYHKVKSANVNVSDMPVKNKINLSKVISSTGDEKHTIATNLKETQVNIVAERPENSTEIKKKSARSVTFKMRGEKGNEFDSGPISVVIHKNTSVMDYPHDVGDNMVHNRQENTATDNIVKDKKTTKKSQGYPLDNKIASTASSAKPVSERKKLNKLIKVVESYFSKEGISKKNEVNHSDKNDLIKNGQTTDKEMHINITGANDPILQIIESLLKQLLT